MRRGKGAQGAKIPWAPDKPFEQEGRNQEMVSFSNDADILKYEPILFGELHLPQQVLATGIGGTVPKAGHPPAARCQPGTPVAWN